MSGKKLPEDGISKTRKILIELQLNGPMTHRKITEVIGPCNSILYKLVKGGYVESYKDFNNDGHKYYERVFVQFYRVTDKPFVERRGRKTSDGDPLPHNFKRDKRRSESIIPRYIAYLEKWGYTVTKKETE